ncbi:MAG: MMPL family transporter [Chloroflexota bacterium]
MVLESFGRLVYRFRWPVVGLWILVSLVALPIAPSLPGVLKAGGYGDPTLESQRASTVLGTALGWQSSTLVVVFHSDRLTTDNPAFAAAANRAMAGLSGLAGVGQISTFALDPQQIAPGHHTAYDTVDLTVAPEDAHHLLPVIRQKISSSVLEVNLTGDPAFYSDVETVSEEDLRRAELLTFPIALFALALVFGSLVSAAGPVVIGGVAVVVALASLALVGRVTDLSIFVLNMVTMLGFGLGTDYSLFLVSRFREELPRRSTEDAVAVTVATAGRAVAFSGLAVFVGLLGLFTFHFMMLRSLGVAGAIVVLLAVLAALTLLPALLGILGPRVNRLPIGPGWETRNLFWDRLAHWVMTHSVRVMLPVFFLLLALGLPFLQAHLSLPDARVLPTSVSSRRGADVFQRDFGESELSSVVIAVQANGSIYSPSNLAALRQFVVDLKADPRVRDVTSIVSLDPRLTEAQYQLLYADPSQISDPYVAAVAHHLASDSTTAVIVTTRAPAIAPETEDLVRAIREYRPGAGLHFLVGGSAGAEVDIVGELYHQFPRTLLLIVGLTYLSLFVLFRSVILPLKAILMNSLSLFASYGALVIIFQDGFLAKLLGFQPLGFVEATLPIIMFCMLFGLSMDYEVFLLTRMQELYEETGDNYFSVTNGLAHSGQVITSAALIVVVVSLCFVSADIVLIKALGLGAAIAIFLDATVVRGLLVPALMQLLGDWNWWAPAIFHPTVPGARARLPDATTVRSSS